MPATSRDDLVRSALRVSTFSAAWTLAASTAAVVVGLASNSLALVAFGVVGILDCAGSVALVAHFRDARSGGSAEHLERIALHVITAGLIAVGLATAAVSVVHLLDESTATSSSAGVILAAVSLVAALRAVAAQAPRRRAAPKPRASRRQPSLGDRRRAGRSHARRHGRDELTRMVVGRPRRRPRDRWRRRKPRHHHAQRARGD